MLDWYVAVGASGQLIITALSDWRNAIKMSQAKKAANLIWPSQW